MRMCACVLVFALLSLYTTSSSLPNSKPEAQIETELIRMHSTIVSDGVAPAPRLQLCVCWDGTCCARGGCHAGLRLRPWWQAVWFDVCVVSSLAACAAPNWGVLPCAAYCVVGLRW